MSMAYIGCACNVFYEISRPRNVLRLPRHWLTQAEKLILRALLLPLTQEGILACLRRHRDRWLSLRWHPMLRVRFDRRIPCWRAGRWRSIT